MHRFAFLSSFSTTLLLASEVNIDSTSSIQFPSTFHANMSVVTSFPSMSGIEACIPSCTLRPIHYQYQTWTKYITPVVVGTAVVIIDDATNLTTTTTSYDSQVTVSGTVRQVSEFMQNGTLIPPPPELSTARTAVVSEIDFVSTVTYPTPLYTIDKSMQWAAVLPYTTNGSAVCSTYGTADSTGHYDIIPSPLPTHEPFSALPSSVDNDDPYGRFYTLWPFYNSTIETVDFASITSLWPYDSQVNAAYASCNETGLAGPVGSLTSVLALLTTSTSHIPASTTGSQISSSPSAVGSSSSSLPSRTTPSSQIAQTSSSVDRSFSSSRQSPSPSSTKSSLPQGSDTSLLSAAPTKSTDSNQGEQLMTASDLIPDSLQPTSTPTVIIGSSTIQENPRPQSMIESQTLAATSANTIAAESLESTSTPPASSSRTFPIDNSAVSDLQPVLGTSSASPQPLSSYISSSESSVSHTVPYQTVQNPAFTPSSSDAPFFLSSVKVFNSSRLLVLSAVFGTAFAFLI